MKSSIKTLLYFTLILLCSAVFSQKFKPVEEIPDGKALVYIYRPGKLLGMAVHYTVNAGEEKVSEAHLKNNSYLIYFAEPGRYTFWASVSGNRKEAELDVEAGKTYYIKGNCCVFKIPELEKAQKEIKKTRLSK